MIETANRIRERIGRAVKAPAGEEGRNPGVPLDLDLIRSGTVNLNGGFASAYASSGGHKHSGLGRERGVEGIRVYQEVQCLNIG